jgi:hypothetical protein
MNRSHSLEITVPPLATIVLAARRTFASRVVAIRDKQANAASMPGVPPKIERGGAPRLQIGTRFLAGDGFCGH